jgi:TonB family protein
MSSPRRKSLLLLLAASSSVLAFGCTTGPEGRDATSPMGRTAAEDPYPEAAKRKGISGRVGLEFTCDASGRAHDVAVVESGGPLLDTGAMKLASTNRCAPGEPSTSRGRLGVIFQLMGSPKVPAFEDNRPTVVVTGYPLSGH